MSHNSGSITRLRAWLQRPRWEWRIHADVDEGKDFRSFVSWRSARRHRKEIRAMAKSVGVKARVRIERVSMDQVHAEQDAFARQIKAQEATDA